MEVLDSKAVAKSGISQLHRRTAKYAFQSVALWTSMQFRNYKLRHCWRFPRASRLGQFLFELRVASGLHDLLYEEIKALSQQSELGLDDAVTLCCNNQIARQMSQKALKKLPGSDSVFYAVDRHGPGGSNVHRCTVADEDDSGDRGPTFIDEEQHSRPLFSSLAQPPVLRLCVGAKVLCTCKLHDKVRTGSIGVVEGFVDPAFADMDDGTDSFEAGYGVDLLGSSAIWIMCNSNTCGLLLHLNMLGASYKYVHLVVYVLDSSCCMYLCSCLVLHHCCG